jgi:hypothetical protein
VARVIRFDPTRQAANVQWGRHPRFDEVGAQIDAQASRLFDSARSLAHSSELYARLESRLPAEDRPLLRELYEALTSHLEKYEHAAYLIGLRAGAGRLDGLPAVLVDDRGPLDDEPQPA